MKEQMIKYWERKERQIEKYPEGGATFLGQAFGALEFAMQMTNDWEAEDELIKLWSNGWLQRLEEKVYEVSFD